jgi:hypothetical protein
MAEPVFVMVKTASLCLHEPETLILDLSHMGCVEVGGTEVGGTEVGGTGVGQFVAKLTEPLLVVEKLSVHFEFTINVTVPDWPA